MTTASHTTNGAQVRVLIVDDEPIARDGLRALLAAHPWITVIGEASNGVVAVELIEQLKPELVFLDIQMPGLSGLQVLSKLVHTPHVIFTTAFAQHAVTAFELGALDYLLKPFGAERLDAALVRVMSAFGEPIPNVTDRMVEAMREGPMDRLFVRRGSAIVPVPVDTVSHFDAWGDYVTAHAESGKHIIHLSLNRLESRLDPKRFVRIHRAHIVNLDFVTAFRSGQKGSLVAELRGGSRLPVSRSKAQALRALGV